MKAFPRVLALVVLLAAAVQAGPDKLLPELKAWLEDVSPILTKTERAVFLNLQTNAERQKFVQLFWRMRDPAPDTSENEFQKEFEERISFADQNFGRESPKRGSQTERGQIYLVLGPPLERKFFTTQSEVQPLELWFYKGEQEYGLPPYFYLIFFQSQGIGEYRLYSPGVDGPERLVLSQTYGNSGTREGAIKIMKGINSELASASQSYIPGEQSYAGGTSSDIIVASIRQVPEKKFKDSYAKSFLAYKDYIETEYADSYIQSSFRVKVFRQGGQPFVHWAIEPEKMNFGVQGSSVYASYELVLRLEDGRGGALLEKTEEIPLRLTPEQYKTYSGRRFAFQDLLAVVPGEHKALFLLKNKTGRDFSSFETKVLVPDADRPGLSVPLLFYAAEAVPEAQRGSMKAFVFGGRQYIVGARSEFTASGVMGVFFQVWHLDKIGLTGPPSFVVEIFSLDTDQSAGVFHLTESAADPGDASTLLVSGSIPTKGLPPGYYRADVSVQSADGRKVLAEKENFVLLSAAVPVVPQVYARLHGPYPGPEHFKVLGTQYFLTGAYGKAREAFERALAAKDDPAARLLLAKSLYGLSLFRESLAQAVPLFELVADRETAKVIALDHAGLKDWEAALSYLEKIMAEATEVPVLNLAAECHLALKHPDKALPLLQKSLSLMPNQPAITVLEEKTRKSLGLK
jgi:GWxTD domain-containing protein